MTKHLDLTLQEGFELTGLWWLPEDVENKIGGVLSYHPLDGILLTLLGTFDATFPPADRFEAKVVNGITSNGILCTLFDNIQVNYSFGSSVFHQQKLLSDLLIMGRHFSSLDELNFARWRISYENLDDWISPKLFDRSYGTDVDGAFAVTVTAKPEEHFNAYLDALNGAITLTTDIFSGSGASSGQIDLSKEAFFELTPNSSQPYEMLNRWYQDVQNLLSLLMVDSIQPRKIHGNLSIDEEDDYSERQSLGIFPRLRYRPIARSTRWHEMLMTFSDLQGHLAMAVERWLEAGHNVRQAIYLFFAETNPKAINVDTEFVNVMHALESYHRSISDGHYLPVEEYQPLLDKMVRAIPEGISPDHRQALKSRLKYGYQYSQRKRFQELFDLLNADLQELVNNGDEAFIGKVVDTRNYLVHRDETSKGLTLESPERVYSYHRLRMLMTILFLKYLGLDDETIHQHVSSNRRVKKFIGSFEEEE